MLETVQIKATTPEAVLKEVFGYNEFRPLQLDIINSLLAGRNNFVLMPTGGGKSICFQIPALLRPGMAIVVSPLISLMQDQVNALKTNGVAAAAYNSALSHLQTQQLLNNLNRGLIKLLYIAPERLLTPAFLERLDHTQVSLFAIDEAHCISHWGHDFRPEYKQLKNLRERYPQVPIIALTATADRPTRQDIRECLGLQDADFHLGSFNRPNIHYAVVEKHKPLQQTLNFLHERSSQSGIIYCLSRKQVDELTSQLKSEGLSVASYHAGMTSEKRQRVQDAFQNEDIQIMVATVAFGMGIDKSNVRFVIHYDLPKNIESYYQETGRAGRDGLPATALLLYRLGDVALIRGFIEKNTEELRRRIETHKLNAMISFAESQTCRRQVLLNYFDETLMQSCGNCDVCQNPPQTYDATVDAQKALSCVYRSQQRFGVGHLIDILRGADNEKIKQRGHEHLSTYGIGKELSQEAWHSIFRQLIHRGFLEQDISNYSILKLTAKAKPLLSNQIQLTLAKPRIKIKTSKTAKSTKRKVIDYSYDNNLFERLRKLRKSLADAAGVPPYIIFNDVTLAQMSAELPKTPQEFLSLSGVGQSKLNSYGEPFLAEIADFLTGAH